jgi:hypothetical protein
MKANRALALRDIFMMLFTTGVLEKMMIDPHLMVSFQVCQNATTVTLRSRADCRQMPTMG